MARNKISGVYAAVLTPRTDKDQIDGPALTRLVQFLMASGISSFAVNGATGEFCLTTPAQLRTILAIVKEASSGASEILCGVGAASASLAIELAAIAEAEGVKALLLPMPYFFPYQQEDLDLFSRAVAASTSLPILLYNLPQFTSGLDKETVLALITDVPNIIGIKDSSGSLDILRHLTQHGVDVCRIVGNDSALAPALIEQVCDGVISGVACVLPEAILALYAQRHHAGSDEFRRAAQRLEEFIEQLNLFPTPWGLKWIAEARGLFRPTFAQPITSHRLAQSHDMAAWFADWYPSVVPAASIAE